ncbi:MAG TPA: acetyltransferase [Roseomonas sp.]|jgi:hypothetical protein
MQDRLGPPADALILFGAGGPLIADVEETCLRLARPVAAAVRNRPGESFAAAATPLIEADGMLPAWRGLDFLCPLFTPANRRAAVAEALALGLRPSAALLDPTTIVSRSAQFAAGGFVNAGCVIGAWVETGPHVVVNRAASLGHHLRVGAFASIGPGVTIAGQVEIGEGALLGAGAVIAPGVRIGAGAVIAPGAVVTRDVPADAIAVGNPARIQARAAGPAEALR